MCARVRVCLCECVFKRKIGRNGEQLQSGMDGWIAGERHTSSIITRKHPPPPFLFSKNLVGKPAAAQTEKKGGRGLRFVLIFIFAASQHLHRSPRDP